MSEQVEADLAAHRIQQREIKKQLENDKRLFYALATRQLEGIDVDKYDPIHDISMPAIRPVNGNSVYSDPWRVQQYPMMTSTTAPSMLTIGNSLFNTSNSEMETWSWKGRPIVKMVSTGVSTLNSITNNETQQIDVPNATMDTTTTSNTNVNSDSKTESKTENIAPTTTVEVVNNASNNIVGNASDTNDQEQAVVTAIFNIIDKEHTGNISKRAFLKAVQLNQIVQDLMANNTNLKCLLQHRMVETKFKTMDENNDGKISIAEMLQFAKELNADQQK